MGAAARVPAICGNVGPRRGKPAIDAGRAKVGKAWRCPACRPVVERREREDFDARQAAVGGVRLPPFILAAAMLGVIGGPER